MRWVGGKNDGRVCSRNGPSKGALQSRGHSREGTSRGGNENAREELIGFAPSSRTAECTP